MSKFSDNLTAQRDKLGMSVQVVTAELNRRGMAVAYSTVAGWFNGSRGERWKVDELIALMDVLRTNVQAMQGDEVELVEAPVPAATARAMKDLTPEQQQAVLAMVTSMGGKR